MVQNIFFCIKDSKCNVHFKIWKMFNKLCLEISSFSCEKLLNKNLFLGFRKYLYTFPHTISLPRGTCTFKWILHISVHRGGPLEGKFDFWNHPFLNFFMTFLAGRSLSAPNVFKNCFETVPFSRKLNFWDVSSGSDYRPWRNKNRLKKLLCALLRI